MSVYETLRVILSEFSVAASYLSLFIACFALIERRKAVILSLQNIINNHHSKDNTKLRKLVRNRFDEKLETAKDKGKMLYEIDDEDEFHIKLSALINYYESLGMFLKSTRFIFRGKVRKNLYKMLHNSVKEHWEQIKDHKDSIHPKPPLDWAYHFEWLYDEIMKYRSKNGLETDDNPDDHQELDKE
jgi:hypothetical protein